MQIVLDKREIKRSNNDWKTPSYIYDPLNIEFNFNFDPCPLNHELLLWDGLDEPWKERNFVNPPYAAAIKKDFIVKGIQESKLGKLCVFLIPVSTSTILYHDIILPNISEPVRFVKRRIKFEGYNSKGVAISKTGAMHDSMIVIFDGRI